jgi:hypothetical protein
VNDSDSDGSSFSELSDSDTCTVEYILITRNKKFLFDNHTRACYANYLCGITGICVWLFTPHMQFLFECLEIGSSHYWQCYNWITMMKSQLGDSQTMTHTSKFGQLLSHHKISGCLHTGRITDYQWGNIPILRAYILSCLYQRKAPQILHKNVWTLWGKKQLRLQPRSKYCGTYYQLRTQHGVQCCWQVVW